MDRDAPAHEGEARRVPAARRRRCWPHTRPTTIRCRRAMPAPSPITASPSCKKALTLDRRADQGRARRIPISRSSRARCCSRTAASPTRSRPIERAVAAEARQRRCSRSSWRRSSSRPNDPTLRAEGDDAAQRGLAVRGRQSPMLWRLSRHRLWPQRQHGHDGAGARRAEHGRAATGTARASRRRAPSSCCRRGRSASAPRTSPTTPGARANAANDGRRRVHAILRPFSASPCWRSTAAAAPRLRRPADARAEGRGRAAHPRTPSPTIPRSSSRR